MPDSAHEGVGAALADAGLTVRAGASLGALTTYRVGGPAAWLVEAGDADELARLAAVTSSAGVDTLVVGKGSNLLVADAGFDGVAVVLGEGFADIAVDGDVVVAGGAASLPVVARRTVAAGLTGFEWAVGVPGSIGGAVRMNAGGHGSDMAASVEEVRVIDLGSGQDVRVSAGECAFGYRRSAITAGQVVVSATLRLAPGGVLAGERELSEIVAWRRRHQPGGPNAGSVFTNPQGDSAGRLIDVAGCKGARVGTASVSTKHANFIQADAGGAADDIVALMTLVRERVLESSGVSLHAETRLVGFAPDVAAAAGVS
ncbi:MAG: UDP-N-acetylmuramate dehydrogenase [Acidimicrobiales bacterium]